MFNDEMRTFKLIGIVILVLFVGVISVTSFTTIPVGYSGVHLRFGNIVGEYAPGPHFKLPLIDSVVKMSTRDEKTDYETDVSSSDMQSIKIKCSVIVGLEPTKVIKVYTKYRDNYMETIVNPMVFELINNETASYPIEQFIDKKPEISNNVKTELNKKLTGSGIVVKDFVITFHDFDDRYETSITQKKISQQQAEKAKYDYEKTRLDSEAMKLKNVALSELVIKEKFIQKWNGVLPTVITGNSGSLMNIDNFLKSK